MSGRSTVKAQLWAHLELCEDLLDLFVVDLVCGGEGAEARLEFGRARAAHVCGDVEVL